MNVSNRVSTLAFAAAVGLCTPVFFPACNDNDSDSENASFTQVDRMGIPALNTVFNHPKTVSGFSKTLYNQRGPDSDLVNYKAQFKTVLGAVANADPEATVLLLLPDELPAKLGSATSDFAALDGRKLEDDAADIALTVAVGPTLPALHSDHVNANDTAFSAEFPFLAGPH
ncbi:MAG: hypothetical protein JWO30_2281 [Fibrobacteres bacterium]|nr:hypothetical protein [Fibrobacterota bacterium]